MTRPLWTALGLLSVGLGVLGIFLPLLPTTPLMILAAWCFAKSSPRLHGWLLGHRVFGPAIRDWQQDGTIAPRAKRAAVLGMVAVFCLSLIMGLRGWILAAQAVALLASGSWVLSRPSGRQG